MVKARKREEEKPEPGPQPAAPPRLTGRNIEESIRRPKGNALTIAVVEALEKGGIKAEVASLGEGRFSIRAEGGEAFLADSFREDENGLSVPGCGLDVKSLRLLWFRKALSEALGCRGDAALYGKLASGQFLSFPGTPIYHISLAPVRIFDDETTKGLREAKAALNPANPLRYAAYLESLFSPQLSGKYEITNPGAGIRAKSGPGLRSIVEEDPGFKESVAKAQTVAREFISEVKNDLQGVRRKISAMQA